MLPSSIAKAITPLNAFRYNTSIFVISLIGIVLDYVTTTIGLSRGFVETHPQYNPVYALVIFWSACGILALTMPKGKWWNRASIFISTWSFLGPVNNILVILGLFSGLHI